MEEEVDPTKQGLKHETYEVVSGESKQEKEKVEAEA
jgi:hypothetical protein